MLRRLIFRLLGVPDLADRLIDLERHFVTKRSLEGKPVETLADVPYAKRKELKQSTKGMNWPQRRWALEAQEAKPNGTVPLRMDA
jgi:hypothetical protein